VRWNFHKNRIKTKTSFFCCCYCFYLCIKILRIKWGNDSKFSLFFFLFQSFEIFIIERKQRGAKKLFYEHGSVSVKMLFFIKELLWDHKTCRCERVSEWVKKRRKILRFVGMKEKFFCVQNVVQIAIPLLCLWGRKNFTQTQSIIILFFMNIG
jgi:hypothetical protein